MLSCATLAEFFVSYCQSQITESKLASLSPDTLQLAAIQGRCVEGSEFQRLTQLARLCPRFDQDRASVLAIRIYFSLLSTIEFLAQRLAPSSVSILERERSGCAHFAAAALDRRIAFSRELYAEQIAGAGL